MNCTMCNSVVPEGQSYCPKCGQYVKQIKYGKNIVNPNVQKPQVTPEEIPVKETVQEKKEQKKVQSMISKAFRQSKPVDKQQSVNKSQPVNKQQSVNRPQPVRKTQQEKKPEVKPPVVKLAADKFNVNTAVKSLTGDITKMASMLGALFIFISPFFRWYSYKYLNVKAQVRDNDYANIFKLSSEQYADNKLFIFFAILMVIVALVLLFTEIVDLIPALVNIRRMVPYLPEIVGIAAALLVLFLWVLVFFNGNIMDLIHNGEAIIATKKEYLGGGIGHSNHGLGPIICLIGIVISIAKKVLALLKIEIKF